MLLMCSTPKAFAQWLNLLNDEVHDGKTSDNISYYVKAPSSMPASGAASCLPLNILCRLPSWLPGSDGPHWIGTISI